MISHILSNLSKVEVLPYNTNWPNMFDIEANKIKTALGDSFACIHHVGSTSIPGLAAKPKIDIIACVKNNYHSVLPCSHPEFISGSNTNLLKILKQVQDDIENIGYEYRGGFNLPFRKSFTYRPPDLNVNLHIFEKDDPEIELNLLFRDYLRAHPETRDRYVTLKYKLLADDSAQKKNGSIYRGYTLGKHDFIQDILKQSGFNRLRFAICTHYTEWEYAKNFRMHYFFGPMKIEDPYTWTFEHKDHKHFILYKGTSIVGYAHIQLWPENRATIRIIVIDEKHQRKGYGKEFMILIEKWLKLEGYKSVHIESSPAALKFYKRINYEEMPFNDPDGYEGCSEDIPMGKLL